jgi:hypothetical protein
MSQLTFPTTEEIKEELDNLHIVCGSTVRVEEDSYNQLRALVDNGGYTHLSDEQRKAIAIGCCLTHPNHKHKHWVMPKLQGKIGAFLRDRFTLWLERPDIAAISAFTFRVLVILCLLGIFGMTAHCQDMAAKAYVNPVAFFQGTSQIDVISFRDSSGTLVKTFAAPFTIKAGTGMTFSVSGSTMTLSPPAGGSGTVTSFSAGTLSPLFTTSVSNPTTTPALSFALSNAAANTVFGNNTGSSAAPGFQSLVLAQLPGSGAVTVNTSAPLGGGGSVSLGNTLSLTCTGCLTSVTAHNILSATHGDTTAAAAVRGDGFFAIGATPTWQRLAHPATTGRCCWQ